MEELDDWRDCNITRPEDIRDLFVPNFFFGCGGDDRSAAAAFDRKMNPYGASLNPMFGSDIGHFDVEEMRGVLEEAHELVHHGLMSTEDFRRFALENPCPLTRPDEQSFLQGHQGGGRSKNHPDCRRDASHQGRRIGGGAYLTWGMWDS
jgi:hypothetical protein